MKDVLHIFKDMEVSSYMKDVLHIFKDMEVSTYMKDGLYFRTWRCLRT